MAANVGILADILLFITPEPLNSFCGHPVSSRIFDLNSGIPPVTAFFPESQRREETGRLSSDADLPKTAPTHRRSTTLADLQRLSEKVSVYAELSSEARTTRRRRCCFEGQKRSGKA
jgi:hypothetical protein